MESVLAQLLAAQAELESQFRVLKGVMGALNTAVKLAGENKADALPMHKALLKLEAAAEVGNETLATAVSRSPTPSSSLSLASSRYMTNRSNV
ncbi:MAG: hypothetical protein KJ069_06345 [Anaerolineae bacterium]|nr:hypothetical protein [Anaerolineae bacterium]